MIVTPPPPAPAGAPLATAASTAVVAGGLFEQLVANLLVSSMSAQLDSQTARAEGHDRPDVTAALIEPLNAGATEEPPLLPQLPPAPVPLLVLDAPTVPGGQKVAALAEGDEPPTQRSEAIDHSDGDVPTSAVPSLQPTATPNSPAVLPSISAVETGAATPIAVARDVPGALLPQMSTPRTVPPMVPSAALPDEAADLAPSAPPLPAPDAEPTPKPPAGQTATPMRVSPPVPARPEAVATIPTPTPVLPGSPPEQDVTPGLGQKNPRPGVTLPTISTSRPSARPTEHLEVQNAPLPTRGEAALAERSAPVVIAAPAPAQTKADAPESSSSVTVSRAVAPDAAYSPNPGSGSEAGQSSDTSDRQGPPPVPHSTTTPALAGASAAVSTSASSPTQTGGQGQSRPAPLEPARLPDAMVGQIREMQQGGQTQRRIVIRLDPPELGTVRLELKTVGDELMVTVRAESAEAVRALVRQQPDLRAAVEALGLALTDFDVQTGHQQNTGQRWNPADRQRRSFSNQSPASQAQDDESTAHQDTEGAMFL